MGLSAFERIPDWESDNMSAKAFDAFLQTNSRGALKTRMTGIRVFLHTAKESIKGATISRI
jgi:hypothetical protein